MGEVSDLMYEREVSINFNDGEDIARVYAASPAWMRKFDRLCAEHPENFRMTEESRENGQVVAKFYEFPKSFLSIKTKKRELNLTEGQRAKARDRLKLGLEKAKETKK